MAYKNYSLLKPSKSKIGINRWNGLNFSSKVSDNEFVNMQNISSDGFNVFARPPREVIKEGIENPQKLLFCGDRLSYISKGSLFVDSGEEFKSAGDVGNVSAAVDFNNQKMLFYPSDMVYDYNKETVEQTMELLEKKDLGDRAINISSVKSCYGVLLMEKDDNENEYIHLLPIKDKDGSDAKNELGVVKYPIISIHCSENPYFYNDYKNYKRTLYIEAYGFNEKGNEICLTQSGGLPVSNYRAFEFGEKIEFGDYYASRIKAVVGYCYYTHNGNVSETCRWCLEAKNADTDKNSTIKYWISPSEYPAPNSRPYIKYACMDNNRVIGVEGNNFYGSCLGDYKNWIDFVDAEGSPKATGAYAEELYTYGDFTGVTKYKNTVIITKKNMLYECYGNKPPYRISLAANTGCIDGRSIVEVGGTLYFLGAGGVYRYSGGLPVNISHKITPGFEVFESGIGTTDGRNYYLYAKGKNRSALLVYDTLTGIWCQEDDAKIVDMTSFDNQVYALTEDGIIYKFKSGSEDVLWELETKEFDLNSSSKKIPKKLTLEVKADMNAKVDVFIKYDGGEYERVASYSTVGNGIVNIKLKTRVCDRFQIKLSGNGDVTLLSLACDVISSNKTHNKDYLIKY